jgi:hypothetical protein
MSLILALSAEELMQPGFIGHNRAAGNRRSGASFGLALAATRRRPGRDQESSVLTRPRANNKYCLKNSAVIIVH